MVQGSFRPISGNYPEMVQGWFRADSEMVGPGITQGSSSDRPGLVQGNAGITRGMILGWWSRENSRDKSGMVHG